MRPRTLLILVVIAACRGRDEGTAQRPADTSVMTSGGSVQLSDGSQLSFVITSDRYKQWDAAQRGIGPTIAARFGALLKPKSPTEQTIAKAVAYLESDASARQAITSSGMTVRDFVLMTVALEQQMRASKNTETERAASAIAPEGGLLPPIDSGYKPAMPPAPYTPPPVPRDTIVRPDTVRRDTTPGRFTVTRVDTVKRDTVVPKRDTVKRDTLPTPPRRDSTSDTTSAARDIRGLP